MKVVESSLAICGIQYYLSVYVSAPHKITEYDRWFHRPIQNFFGIWLDRNLFWSFADHIFLRGTPFSRNLPTFSLDFYQHYTFLPPFKKLLIKKMPMESNKLLEKSHLGSSTIKKIYIYQRPAMQSGSFTQNGSKLRIFSSFSFRVL